MRHGEHGGRNRHMKCGDGRGGHPKHGGAQTFRRGRALEFLQRLDIKRATLSQQLAQRELASIHPVISGELKAIELVRNEFIELFELYEATAAGRDDAQGDASGADDTDRRSSPDAMDGASLDAMDGDASQES
ncbi:hypothetical protein [Alicyclobacillus acidiphilus]|uniref:hypothetical protein n=1 Tax=Alicyclobacillus acidiphilus TaxID=182455 RepID=UPI000AF3984C|nr:hypothetical protein [Alicyclobacillus acidiphilus]